MWPANVMGKEKKKNKKKKNKTGSYMHRQHFPWFLCVHSASTWLPLSDCQRLHWSFGFFWQVFHSPNSFHLNVHQFPLLIKQQVPWFSNKEWLRPFSHYDLWHHNLKERTMGCMNDMHEEAQTQTVMLSAYWS